MKTNSPENQKMTQLWFFLRSRHLKFGKQILGIEVLQSNELRLIIIV